jgi:formylglycine-generating enzyme
VGESANTFLIARAALLIDAFSIGQQMKTPNLFTILLAALLANIFSPRAWSDTFGSGANTFNIDFVSIGNPGNAADTTGNPNPAGSVPYVYRIGKFEISEQMIDKANILGGLGITKDTRGIDNPATSVSWNGAMRFVNWLNTSAGSTAAYKFAIQPGEIGYSPNANIELWTISDPGYNPNNLFRNSLARYFLPSDDEWYKAAYYDPTSGVYYDYPTGSNTAPTAVASGTASGTAVYNQVSTTGPADITLAGGLSPYGTMGQGGNVYEWEETEYDLVNNSSLSVRGVRGGDLGFDPSSLLSSLRFNNPPSLGSATLGFRVASVPELLPGDYNGNGAVENADLTLLLTNWSHPVPPVPAGWIGSPQPTAPAIDNDELTPLLTHWGQHIPGAGAGAAVPEPTSIALAVVGLAGFGFVARRRHAGRRHWP